MAKRELPEISAGSMADIAFLLLIFFLVTTTMDKDTALIRQMPLKIDVEYKEQQLVAKRNLMRIQANAQGRLLIRDEEATIADIRGKVTQFYKTNMNDEVDPLWPRYEVVDKIFCDTNIRNINREIDVMLEAGGLDDFVTFKTAERDEFEKRLRVITTLNKPYREIVRVAGIQIELQTRTNYELLVSILNEIKAAINDIRDEKALELFGVSYRNMVQKGTTDPKFELEYADKVELIEILIPERINELPPADMAKK
jgi:biopolymer transport protein ExbD